MQRHVCIVLLSMNWSLTYARRNNLFKQLDINQQDFQAELPFVKSD